MPEVTVISETDIKQGAIGSLSSLQVAVQKELDKVKAQQDVNAFPSGSEAAGKWRSALEMVNLLLKNEITAQGA